MNPQQIFTGGNLIMTAVHPVHLEVILGLLVL
jgi:hypothetical protein